MKVGLIDGDMVAFSHSAAEEYGKEEHEVNFHHICNSMDSKIEFLMKRLKLDKVLVFLSGDDNYRFVINDEYKANRDGVWRPANLKNAKAHLRTVWNAYTMHGLEADDLIAIFAKSNYDIVEGKFHIIKELNNPVPWGADDELIVCSLDKDLKQIGGTTNYRWETGSQGEKKEKVSGFGDLHLIIKTSGNGKTKKKEVKGLGTKFFLWQLLTGDGTDGIIGCGISTTTIYKSGAKAGQERKLRVGIGAIEAFEILEKCTDYRSGLLEVIKCYQRIFGVDWEANLVKAGRQLYMTNTIKDGHFARMWHFRPIVEWFDLQKQEIIRFEG